MSETIGELLAEMRAVGVGVDNTDCKHGTVQAWCAICKGHGPKCTRWGGRVTCKDHGVQLSTDVPEDFGGPRSERTKTWAFLSRRTVDLYGQEYPQHEEYFPWPTRRAAAFAKGYAPQGEWPALEGVPHTVIGPLQKAAYKFDVVEYDWLGVGKRRYFSGIGHSWAALEVANRRWIRNEAILDDGDPSTDNPEFTGSRIKWQRPTASGATAWRTPPGV